MYEQAGKTAVGAIFAMIMVVGTGFGLSTVGAGTTSSATTTTTVTQSASFALPTACLELIYNETYGSITGAHLACTGSIGLRNGESALNVTSNQVLSAMLTNGFLNAFYVNVTSRQVAQIPGVTFSSNYEQAFYNGQPIINGTKVPTPYMSPTNTTKVG